MSHPFNKFRQSNVERARAGELVKNYKSGGEVHADAEQDKKLIKRMIGKQLGDIGGVKAAQRMDRPRRASGGKVAKKGTTIVNVITGGQQQPPMPPPMPPAAMAPPPPPPGPPPGMGPPPGAGGPPGLGGAGPGMPPGPPMRARGGKVKTTAGSKGTPVQHDNAKAVDIANMNRKRVVTFATGGGVVSFKASGGAVKGVTFSAGADPKSKLPGGAGGGEGRLAKARKY